MPRDISDSDSEEDVVEEKEPQTTIRETRFECPEDFTPVSYIPCSGAKGPCLFDQNKELWLIKAPVNFDPSSLVGKKLPLSGLKKMGPDPIVATQQIFSVVGKRSSPTGLHLLTSGPSQVDTNLQFSPGFSGMLNIFESFGGCDPSLVSTVIPAAPAPKLPDGLKQRFFPFGTKRPATAPLMKDTSIELVATEASRVLKEERMETEEVSKKRKKEKKEKKAKVKVEEAVDTNLVLKEMELSVKLEPASQSAPDLMTAEDEVKEQRKKKKKKKDREREIIEDTKPCIAVKLMPVDGENADSERVPKKKKKKIKNEND